MTSFIIISKNKNQRIDFAHLYCKELKIDNLDITFIENDTTTKQNSQSIGIEDVKNMQKKIFLKPIKSKKKAIIIEESHLLTTEAQNALLKVLEEPPNHTIIMLTTESKDSLLPTILSRCKVIQLKEEKATIPEKEVKEYEAFIENLPSLKVGERLKKAELLAKDKEKAIEWVTNLILILREKMLRTYSSNEKAFDTPDNLAIIDILRRLQSLHTLLKTTNVNPRFAFEDTFLTL